MYKELRDKLERRYEDMSICLNGKPFRPNKSLEYGFRIFIRLVQNKDELPISLSRFFVDKTTNLIEPIEKVINKLKQTKNDGFDKNNIELLSSVLDVLKALNDADLHKNLKKFIRLVDKEGKKKKLIKNIDHIEYDGTVKETKNMLNECKESLSQQGLSKDMVHQNQAKRLTFLKDSAAKFKTLIHAGSKNVCSHLNMAEDEYQNQYVKPCTKKLAEDIKERELETKKAFNKTKLKTKELDQANANLEAFHAIKNVFEQEIDDNDQLFKEINVKEAITKCEKVAIEKVDELAKQIQYSEIDEKNVDEYIGQSAKALINLEYLNKHINYKTSFTNEDESDDNNELCQGIDSGIKSSMQFLTKNKHTKTKINTLYHDLTEVDANYGAVFTQQHPAFKASLTKAMNQQFRSLDKTALIENLKMTQNEIKSKHDKLIDIDYNRIDNIFTKIIKKYNEMIMKNLRAARTFEELKSDYIPTLANDVRNIAQKAVGSKQNWLKKTLSSGVNYVKSNFTWSNDDNTRKNPRKGYWTKEMIGATSEIIPYILAIWSLSGASCFYEANDKETLKKARNAQIVAICCLLCLDTESNSKELINNLVEVGTGEGKSVIMAITAITLALLDFDVYCACYSELLSKRDEQAFNDLFVLLGVQNNIHYQTFNNIFEQVINDGGDIREITKNIVLEEKIEDDKKSSDEKEKQKRLLQKRQKILFIDEVDKFFSTDFFGKQYTPSCIIAKEEMKNLILFVWNRYLSNNRRGMSITMSLIQNSGEFTALLNAFNEEWHDLLKESIKDIIDAIRTFEDDTYIISDHRDICYKFSDSYSSKVFYGYRTIFAYLHELNAGNISDKNYVDQKLTWFLKCGSFSYSEIPFEFYNILGVTGTLNSLSQKEHDVIQNSYGVKKYIVMPSLFDKSGKLDYAKNKHISVLAREYFYNQLHSTIQGYRVNDNTAVQRPIIIFFKDENKLNDFYNLDICKSWIQDEITQKLTPDLSEKEKLTGILNATKPNMITFATEEYGRGIDFKVFDKQLVNRGMHVELTYWPDTLAEEIQIRGRTARQGQKGSFHIILNMDEVKDQCNATNEEIKQHQDNGDVYEWINGIRNKVFAKQYDEATKYVEQLRPIHEQSEMLAAALREKNVKSAKKQLLLFNKGANIQSAAKLSILIDATGSMGSCLRQCKIVIQQTIPKLISFLNKNGIDSESFEIQVIAYRNYDCPADTILEYCPFTSNKNTLTDFIHSIRAKCGWGAEEAVEVGFKQLNKQKKKPNIVILMADAPAHTKEAMMRKRKSRGETYWNSQNDGVFTDLDWKQEVDLFMQQNGKSRVFCFYLNNYVKTNFDEIAKIGNGKSMLLNVNNQNESVNRLQGALSETILYVINNGDMTIVNQFRQENKNIPTFL